MTYVDPVTPFASPAVSYATPAPRPGAKAWAGAAIILGGLGLVGLGGCFLIGVLSIISVPSFAPGAAVAPALSAAQLLLMTVLYVLAFLSFAGGATLLFVGTRELLRLMRR
jgi:hypothetical protein